MLMGTSLTRVKEHGLEITLSIIIVSYNTEDLIGKCLDTVIRYGINQQEIFVVDNNSSDRGASLIKDGYPLVNLIENKSNKGFAAANNQAFKRCSGKYILFLNPDTEMPAGSISSMLDYMDGHPSVGLAGARIINPDSTLQRSVSYKYPGEQHTSGELDGLPGEIACVLGACMIAPRRLLEEIDCFSEDFFLYGEDQDLCLRIRKAGYEIGYIENAPVVHIGGQSERGIADYEKWKKKVDAEYLFYQKYYRPGTTRRIERSNLLMSRWRILTLSMMIPFLTKKKRMEAEGKRAKYMAIYDTVRKNQS